MSRNFSGPFHQQFLFIFRYRLRDFKKSKLYKSCKHFSGIWSINSAQLLNLQARELQEHHQYSDARRKRKMLLEKTSRLFYEGILQEEKAGIWREQAGFTPTSDSHWQAAAHNYFSLFGSSLRLLCKNQNTDKGCSYSVTRREKLNFFKFKSMTSAHFFSVS